MSLRITAGFVLLAVLVGLVVCIMFAATGNWENVADLFRLGGKLDAEKGQIMALLTCVSLSLLVFVLVFWHLWPRFRLATCASLNPAFDPRKSVKRFMLSGIVVLAIPLAVGSMLTLYDGGWMVAIIAFVFEVVAYLAALQLLASPIYRKFLN